MLYLYTMSDQQKMTPEQREAECNLQPTVKWAINFAHQLLKFAGAFAYAKESLLEEKRDEIVKYHKMRLHFDKIKDS